MADSDEDNDRDYESEMSLTGFMFGNIDENGQLENDILDPNAKRHLSSLCHFGLGSLLQEIMSEEKADKKEQYQSNSEESNKEPVENGKPKHDEAEDVDYFVKDPEALDFSDINELAEDCIDPQQGMLNGTKSEKETDYDADDEDLDHKQDKDLMPPPPVPEEKEVLTAEEEEAAIKRRLETPLASMLPSKYADVDVTELFPDFRPGKVLRFSKLFGPGKPSSLPQIWRGVRKRRKKKRIQDTKDSDSGSDQENKRTKFKGWVMNYGTEPTSEQLDEDDEERLLLPVKDKEQEKSPGDIGENDTGPKVADWRFGPAQIWYDILEVPNTGEGFNYGFKLAEKVENDKPIKDEHIDEEAFLMVSQLHWEDDVIWNGDDIKHKTRNKLNTRNKAAGWIPSSDNRTAQSFSQPGKVLPGQVTPNVRLATSQITTPTHMQIQKNKSAIGKGQSNEYHDDTWYSIFPVENEELVYGLWEEEIIWDAESMKKIPKPKILTLDPNDENIILGIPDDIDPALLHKNDGPQPKVKIPHPHVKKSKLLLGKAGVINVLEEDAPPPPPKSPTNQDPFNISNDTYYMPKSSETTIRLKVGGGNLIQHSTPVVELRTPFVPTHMGPMRLRNFHRPPLKRFSHGILAHPGPHGVLPLIKFIKKQAKLREQERIASGGGDVFFMRTPKDLTGRDGEIVLIEFSEEHPPLVNQVGMCSKIKNYYKRKAGKDTGPPEYKYGETSYAHTSPFLGILTPGQTIQTMENNMYRAPLYEHKVNETDFLVIRTRDQYYIREIDALFVAGQECPLYEVPGPNSKRANNFVRDFLQVFIYRLFWKSKDNPRRIKMDDIKRAFPSHSESSIRKRLKLCADFKRTGMDSNWWVIKPEFRLPTEEEIRAMVSPEQCCAYFSMIAAEQRLKDAGYGEKFLFTPQDDDDEEMQLKMDDEIKVAPWNTTRAYIQAMKGKCLLQLTGPADPTGMGEGFSYVRVPNKPTVSKEEQEAQPKRTVTGTDADLRRLSLNNAKALLRKFGVPDEEIKKLSRWEVIDVVRTLSTEKAKAGEEGMTKFSRGNRFSIAEHQERYKEECQRIFDLQNRVLSSNEVLSTDEGESSDEDSSDIEEMGKNIENMLSNKKTSTQLVLEREEQQRQELKKMMMNNDNSDDKKFKDKKKDANEDENSSSNFNTQSGRVLKIYRTYRNADGSVFTRTEIVRKPAVIDTYLKIRNSKDESFIKQFATIDEAQKEEMKREKRRIQEQLRRIRRNQEREKMLAGGHSSSHFNLLNLPSSPIDHSGASSPISGSFDGNTSTSNFLFPSNKQSPFQSHTPSYKLFKSELFSSSPSKRKKFKLKPDLKLKCGACGNVGHMRTNKACPLYQNNFGGGPSTPTATVTSEDQEDETEKQFYPGDQDLVNVDGTKVKLSSKLIKHAEEMKRRTLLLKVPKDVSSSTRKRKRQLDDDQFDYVKRYQRPAGANRQRTDPVIVLSSIFEDIINNIRATKDFAPFWFPVNSKAVPDYYIIITQPIDLQTIRDKLRDKKYESREDFLADMNQIKLNSSLYNGPKHILTDLAQRMLDMCVKLVADKEDKIMRLEKAINPLLDDNDQVAFTYILTSMIENMVKIMPEATQFLKPVNKKVIKDYYNIIRNPMDIETIHKKCLAHKYHSRGEIIRDFQQIYDNSTVYNGELSPLTLKADLLLRAVKDYLTNLPQRATELEESIMKTQQKAMEQDDSWMPDEENYTIPEPEFQGSQINSPEHVFKSNMDDCDIVDVEGVDIDVELGKPAAIQKKDVLEEDLQFSSEDEFDEVPFGVDDTFEATELKPLMPIEVAPDELPADDDSQQVAEAMIQLGNAGSYSLEQPLNNAEESVDSNYDPSDAFFTTIPARKDDYKIQDDLAVSESDEEEQRSDIKIEKHPIPQPSEDDLGNVWF
ncbi:transcription initiation factor TFIID subunit 1-like isoform X2 [Phymastichus coffea]|uniref:transcription initiation factor TFIID subunit 1-like isoform X2 n=1 Tax=Phymastichus coffea TaxID=108790 RepID=UPI00273C8349|nr:transcription initiation factor TFIID subunit 1-like isoform X2 [Phymastichus coffea]